MKKWQWGTGSQASPVLFSTHAPHKTAAPNRRKAFRCNRGGPHRALSKTDSLLHCHLSRCNQLNSSLRTRSIPCLHTRATWQLRGKWPYCKGSHTSSCLSQLAVHSLCTHLGKHLWFPLPFSRGHWCALQIPKQVHWYL